VRGSNSQPAVAATATGSGNNRTETLLLSQQSINCGNKIVVAAALEMVQWAAVSQWQWSQWLLLLVDRYAAILAAMF